MIKAFITLQAVFVFPAVRRVIAFDSFELRLAAVPAGRLKLFTNAAKLLIWSTAPLTVTVKPQELEFPDPSVAPQETDVAPIGKIDPDVGVQLDVMVPEQLSDTVGLKIATAPFGPVASIA